MREVVTVGLRGYPVVTVTFCYKVATGNLVILALQLHFSIESKDEQAPKQSSRNYGRQ